MIKESLEGMVYKVKVFGVTLLSAIQLAPPLFASPNLQPRSIDVYVQDALFNQGTSGWQVQVLDKNTAEVLDAGVTDGSGYVKLDYDDVVGVEDEGVLPNDYRVSNQYPQPSNGVTKQDVQTPRPVDISAVFYDVKGEEVFRLDPKRVFSGVSTTMGVLNGLASGVYFQKTIITDDAGNEYNFIQKIALVKDGVGVSGVAGIQSGTKSFIPESQVYQKQESKMPTSVSLNKPGEIRDSVDIKIVAPNYEQYVKRVSVEDLVLNAEINQIPVVETKNVVGVQTNLQTGEAVKNANYTIEDENGNVLKSGQLDVQGQMNEIVQVNKWYWAPLDSTIRDIDTIKAILSKDLYNQKTYTKTVGSSNQLDVSGQMEHQGRLHQFNFRNYDISGFDIDSMTVLLVTPDGNIPLQQQNNNLPVEYTEFHDDPVVEVQMKNLNSKFLDWVSATTTDDYIEYLFQNTKQDSNLVIPLSLAESQGQMELYWVPARVEHPYAPGQFISMDSDTVKSMIDYTDFFTSCFRSIPERDSVYRILFTENQTTGDPVPQSELNIAINTHDLVNSIVKQFEGNGKTAVKTTPIYQITGPNSAFWQNLINITVHNINYINFEQVPTPGNAVAIAFPEWRIKNSHALWAEGTAWQSMFEEIYSSMTHTEDPFTGQPQVAYLISNGQPTKLSKKMANLVYVFEPGSIFE